MQKKFLLSSIIFLCLLCWQGIGLGAYHHEGEKDAGRFLQVYPDKAGTKLDHCALCHTGGETVDGKGRTVELGSCQWCHETYGYGGTGDIAATMNPYGAAYLTAGRSSAAISVIDILDSDGDTYPNHAEIDAGAFPGNADDHPDLKPAPYRIYTKKQLEFLPQHTQFLLMNTSRSGDFYTEYTGVPMRDLLDDAGITPEATNIVAYAPDGWAQYHPLQYEEGGEMYHVYGNYPGQPYQYPPASFAYNRQADQALNPTDGWCDYSAPSCAGRNQGDPIFVGNGLKAILALQREGAPLDAGVLTDENKLDGEGPFRLVVPQKVPSPPDQSSRAGNQDVTWPYDWDWDHNAGACSRTVTLIKVEPLPEGTTDIDILEAGWNYVDQEKIIVYGAIDATDSNQNGVLDSEEKEDEMSDYDGDGIPDYQDRDTAKVKHVNGDSRLLLHTSSGELSKVRCLSDDDPALSQAGKPALSFPWGAVAFNITVSSPGDSAILDLVFPLNVPLNARYYKIDRVHGWREIAFEDNDGDNHIRITLTDGDALTDADGVENGVIVDPGALAVTADDTPLPAEAAAANSRDSSSCFIMSLLD